MQKRNMPFVSNTCSGRNDPAEINAPARKPLAARAESESTRRRAIAVFNVGWDQLASSVGPPSGIVEKSWWASAAKRRWSFP
jgi:hypothetical protein